MVHRFRIALPLIACALLGAGCGGTSPPGGTAGPHGTDGTFKFSWLINGVDPADASDPCTQADIRFIRMVITSYNDATMHDDSFGFDCRLGHYMSAQPELRAGAYRVYWEADAADGTMISSTFVPSTSMPQPGEVIHVTNGTNVDFDAENRPDTTFMGAPTDFATGSGPLTVPVFWAAHADDTTGSDCATAGVATVGWTLRMSNNVVIDQQPAPGGQRTTCSPQLTWPDLNWDDYSLDIDGYDASGTRAWHGHCGGQLVTHPAPTDTDGFTPPPAPPRCFVAHSS